MVSRAVTGVTVVPGGGNSGGVAYWAGTAGRNAGAVAATSAGWGLSRVCGAVGGCDELGRQAMAHFRGRAVGKGRTVEVVFGWHVPESETASTKGGASRPRSIAHTSFCSAGTWNTKSSCCCCSWLASNWSPTRLVPATLLSTCIRGWSVANEMEQNPSITSPGVMAMKLAWSSGGPSSLVQGFAQPAVAVSGGLAPGLTVRWPSTPKLGSPRCSASGSATGCPREVSDASTTSHTR